MNPNNITKYGKFVLLTVAFIATIIFIRQQNNEIRKINTYVAELQGQIFSLNEAINSNVKVIELKDSELEQQRQIIAKQKDESETQKNLINMLDAKLDAFGVKIKTAPVYKVTAYDLSVASCGKPIGSAGYGVTSRGVTLAGTSRTVAKTIAVDPDVIPLGTRVYVSFEGKYKHLSGVYTANDTGGAVKGRHIDLFMGDYKKRTESKAVMDFGVQYARVLIL
jgi:3D (Asp-Asp-Asp) domain-containing protein